jgi:inner membrane protein
MASAFGHAMAALAIGSTFKKKVRSMKFVLIGIVCAIFPDIDAIGFKLGVAYDSFWGHRGFTHSLLFALFTAIIVTTVFFRKEAQGRFILLYVFFFFLCVASHSVLDAMTSGGLGVAFFSPFNDDRYFFPWRPIKVSPIGVSSFFSEWGWRVLKSELIWIGIPSAAYVLFVRGVLMKSSKEKNRD